MYHHLPPLIQRVDFHASLNEARDRLRSGRDTSAWDFYEVACLELFVVELLAQELLASFRAPGAPNPTMISKLQEMNASLDSWGARWIQTGTPAERDSNGIVITCAVARLYINTYAIQGLEGTIAISALEPVRLTCIRQGTESALDIIRTALRSSMFRSTLCFAIDFVLTNSLKMSSDYLLSVCRLLPSTLDVSAVLGTLRNLVEFLETFGPREERYLVEYANMRARVDDALVEAAIQESPVGLDMEGGMFDGFDVMEAGAMWQTLFQNTLDGSDTLGWL
ncbi:hypothetical protein RQP46_010658 [Phenoliferia psychrophenolica]